MRLSGSAISACDILEWRAISNTTLALPISVVVLELTSVTRILDVHGSYPYRNTVHFKVSVIFLSPCGNHDIHTYIHPPPSSAEVKERVELYFYSPSGPSWPVLGRTFTFYLTFISLQKPDDGPRGPKHVAYQ